MSHDFCNLFMSIQCLDNSISQPQFEPKEMLEGGEEAQENTDTANKPEYRALQSSISLQC